MTKECLHILPVDDMSSVEERIKVIKASLGEKKHIIHRLRNSIAVVVEEAKEVIDEVSNNIDEKSSLKMSYDDFVYGMRKLLKR